MVSKWFLSIVAVLALIPRGAHAEERPHVQLTIVADNVRSATGVVGVLLFNSARGWPERVEDSVRHEAVPARPGVTVVTLNDVPPGDYAVVVLHDENENMKLDRGPFGIPREGWGMSNNPRAHFSAPSFAQARFTVTADTRLQIRLNY